MAMPSSGSTVPRTDSAGICTTNSSSAVNVRTLTRMLKPRPKKALVSPLVQYGSLSEPSDDAEFLKPVRFMRILPASEWDREEGGWARLSVGGSGDISRPAPLPALLPVQWLSQRPPVPWGSAPG